MPHDCPTCNRYPMVCMGCMNIQCTCKAPVPAGALVVCKACGKNPAVVGGGLNGRGLCIVCRHPGKRASKVAGKVPE